ncbi:MAG: RluA family pseudouridine synthase, partial [Actinomycetota bacterium]
RYLALVAGVPATPVGRIEAPIGRHPRWRTRFAVVGDGRPAVTRYRTVATGQLKVDGDQPVEVALLVCRLETGRTHQIRVHLRELGHPVLGDPTYGPRQPDSTAIGLDRPALHAALLAFEHPVTGEQVRLIEPLPPQLEQLGERAGITAGPTQLAAWLR